MYGLSQGGGLTVPKEEEVDWSNPPMSPVRSGPVLVLQDPASTVFTPSAVEIPDPEWQPSGPYQPPVDDPVEEKEGLKDWQKVAAGMAVAGLFLLLRGK